MEIRWYYKVIRHSIWLIILSMLIPAIVALIVSQVLPHSYIAQTEVVLYKSKANLIFDSRFQTISEDDLIRLSGQDPRRQTLAALAISDQVLSDTIASLPVDLQKGWSVDKLSGKVAVETVGNLLILTANGSNPQEAATLTNLWAQAFAHIANQSFSPPSTTVQVLMGQKDTAQLAYDEAERFLVDFLADNQIDELQFQVSVVERAINDLRDAYQSTEKSGLMDTVRVKQQVPLLINQAQSLRSTLAQDPDTDPIDTATQVSILLLAATAYNSSQTSLPVTADKVIPATQSQIQLSIQSLIETPQTTSEAIVSLDRFITSLSSLGVTLEQSSLDKGKILLSAPELTQALLSEILSLQVDLDRNSANLEKEKSKLKEITQTRDLEWENYKILSGKASEASIALQTAETEVVIATQAIAPQKPSGSNKIINTAIAGLLGLFFGLVIALLRAHLNESPVH